MSKDAGMEVDYAISLMEIAERALQGTTLTVEQFLKLERTVDQLRQCYAAATGTPNANPDEPFTIGLNGFDPYNPESITEDFFCPPPPSSQSGSEVETLPGNKMRLELIQQAIEAQSRKIGKHWCVEVREDTEEAKFDDAMEALGETK